MEVEPIQFEKNGVGLHHPHERVDEHRISKWSIGTHLHGMVAELDTIENQPRDAKQWGVWMVTDRNRNCVMHHETRMDG